MQKYFFSLFFLFSSVFFPLHAQNKTIVALQLHFTRTESQGGQSTTMAGSVLYTKNPFTFVFATTQPVAQTAYLNQDGAFLRQDAQDYAITQGADALLQTCTDFLNWFKADFALAETGFAPSVCSVQGKTMQVEWRYTKTNEHPIGKVLVTMHANGLYEEMQMFGNDDALITKTTLSDYQKSGAYRYPTLIRSERYPDGAPPVITTMQFSDVRFNQLEPSPYAARMPKTQDVPLAKRVDATYQTAQIPAGQTYYVSLPSVLTLAGFSVYKACITSQDMSRCPYEPSCSQYMLQAVRAHGVVGILEGIERKRRCTTTEHKRGLYPDTKNGKHYDPVVRSGGNE